LRSDQQRQGFVREDAVAANPDRADREQFRPPRVQTAGFAIEAHRVAIVVVEQRQEARVAQAGPAARVEPGGQHQKFASRK
jgi:hypothetical protein